MEIVIPTHSLEKMIFEICNLTFFREIGTGKEPDAGSELQKLLNIQNTSCHHEVECPPKEHNDATKSRFRPDEPEYRPVQGVPLRADEPEYRPVQKSPFRPDEPEYRLKEQNASQNTELLPNAPDKREIIQPPNLGPNKIW